MHIESIELHRIQIPFRRAFKHAAHARDQTDAVLVAVADGEGNEGWGEIKPRPYVTGETQQSVLEQSAPQLATALLRAQFDTPDSVVAWLERAAEGVDGALATLGGFDLALLDLAGQHFGCGVADFLGGATRAELPAGVVVGFEHSTATLGRYCAALRLSGKTHVKVKVGLDDDADRLAVVAKVFKGKPIRIDANAAWTADQAIERIEALKAVAPIASVEQPVAAGDHEGLARIRAETGVLVMADESVCSADDARHLIAAGAADIFNVRLGKNGGLLASKRLAELATRAGIAVHLGTMVGESGVLSAAGEIFGTCVPGFECLDGKGQNHFLLEVDILGESSDHRASLGLGIRVDRDRVRKHQVGATQRFSSAENT